MAVYIYGRVGDFGRVSERFADLALGLGKHGPMSRKEYKLKVAPVEG
jgi:hypothetical protein